MPEPQVFGFASIEEAFDYMHRNEMAANATLHEKQKAITYGDHWIRFWDIPSRTLIFGKVMTVEEFAESERTASTKDDPVTPSELEYELGELRQRHGRGFMFGYCWSTIEPRGELGDTHQANMWPISQELFEAAQAAEWVIDALDQDAKVALSNVYLDWLTHEKAKEALHRANGGS